MNQSMRLLCLVTLLAMTTAGARAGTDEPAPGDDFRAAASEHVQQAQHAVETTASGQGDEPGRHIQLAIVYRQMAGLERRAAALADADRWDEIDWSRYHELEADREHLLDALQASQALPETDSSDDPAHDFEVAAGEYEAQAREARDHARDAHGLEQAVYEDLVAVFQQMADIKYQAARADRANRDFDWSRYEVLSEQRDGLLDLLQRAR